MTERMDRLAEAKTMDERREVLEDARWENRLTRANVKVGDRVRYVGMGHFAVDGRAFNRLTVEQRTNNALAMTAAVFRVSRILTSGAITVEPADDGVREMLDAAGLSNTVATTGWQLTNDYSRYNPKWRRYPIWERVPEDIARRVVDRVQGLTRMLREVRAREEEAPVAVTVQPAGRVYENPGDLEARLEALSRQMDMSSAQLDGAIGELFGDPTPSAISGLGQLVTRRIEVVVEEIYRPVNEMVKRHVAEVRPVTKADYLALLADMREMEKKVTVRMRAAIEGLEKAIKGMDDRTK
jgi:hypothetical protein